MKKLFIQSSCMLLSTFLLVGCSEGACCEDDVKILSNTQPKGNIVVEDVFVENKSKEPVVVPLAPVAKADVNCQSYFMIKVCASEAVEFDASGSYDRDGDSQNLSYMWSNLNQEIISSKKSFVTSYEERGFYETTLSVKDEQNLTSIDRVCVLVEMDELDIPLVAKAGQDIDILIDEKVTLSGRGVCRSDVLKYEWREGDVLLSSNAEFDKSFEVGQHTLVLTIEDLEGNRAVDSVIVTAKRG